MRARDKVSVSTLRATLAALDNAEAVPVGEAGLRGVALEHSPVGAGTTEAVRSELSERDVVDIVHAEITERLDAAAQLTAPAHAGRAARLRAEAAVLQRLLDGPGAA
ncbi:GatB/YqeY domain-containing protein [Streptomyces sp. UNOC14_S4]|uniref:GatB/YqeY domain-containing protein n=1 Tax=Streptomyces sp. UNOC14_S4 TaxID=2872340 RepID=UPI001E2A137C|nr:GatB/YqeY domain-containing protein [Streptomyces sp. UNOC14_S4]MCC3768810.1 GatB/YqeY domain-containing protein [Streptomyces sp. UNOC14_S4]